MIRRLFARIADAFRWPDIEPQAPSLYDALTTARGFVAGELAARGPEDVNYEPTAADTLHVIDLALDAEDRRRVMIATAMQQAQL